MSNSFRTQKPAAAARRRLRRDEEGLVVLPRIVSRRPRRGDHHPLSAQTLRRVLRREVPVEYLNGLKRIELRPRVSDVVGEPFACYLKGEKVIILYSLPRSWSWSSQVSADLIDKMRRFFAVITECPAGVQVEWPAAEVLSMWYFVEVFAHELGHHYRTQYRIRRGSSRRRRHEEFVAELHSGRFYNALLARIRTRRLQSAPPPEAP